MAAKKKAVLNSSFIPMEPEEITAEWLFEVINQYRILKEMSLVKSPDDLVSCEIAEKKSSKGRLSSTYVIDIKFKVRREFAEIILHQKPQQHRNFQEKRNPFHGRFPHKTARFGYAKLMKFEEWSIHTQFSSVSI